MPNLTKPACMGGQLKPTEANAPAEWLEFIAASIFHLGAKCKRAHQAVRARQSRDEDFYTDQELDDRMALMEDTFLKAKGEVQNKIKEHKALRAIHYNRQDVERRYRALRAEEAKYL